MTSPNIALFLELESLMVDNAEFSHPCDTDDITKASGSIPLQDILELLNRHRSSLPVGFFALPNKDGYPIAETVLCERHFNDPGRQSYAENFAENTGRNGSMEWFKVAALARPVCCDCHDNYDNL